MIGSMLSTSPRRLAVYSAAVVAASLVGTLFTRGGESTWADAGVRQALLAAAFSLGPAVVIVAAARVGPRGVALLAALLAAGMLAMWWLFASRESSTSALVFLVGWWIGVPIAMVVTLAASVRSSREAAGVPEGGADPVR